MSKIIVLVGPTGVGKTRISILLAKYLNAEIINADSVSIYKEFNIGSAKVTEEEMEGVKHHLIDQIEVDKNYTVYNYQVDARNVLNGLLKSNKNVIITGGTGLYIKALLYNYTFQEENGNGLTYDDLSNIELKQQANDIYAENNIHINNRKRLIRFLNSYNKTGKIIKNEAKDEKVYDFNVVGLTLDRDILYERINLRVDKMLEDGLLNEAKNLYDKKALIFSNIIGYKEFISYFEGNSSLENAINLIKQHTRNYAKRQYTWLNNQMDVKWYNVDLNNIENTVNEIIKQESL